MKTFGYGNVEICEKDFQIALAISQEIDRIKEQREHHKHLERADYLHVWDYDRKCSKCGILQKDYRYSLYEYQKNIGGTTLPPVCKDYK